MLFLLCNVCDTILFFYRLQQDKQLLLIKILKTLILQLYELGNEPDREVFLDEFIAFRMNKGIVYVLHMLEN